MAHTDTWNAAFEASPADGDQVAEGAERIRDLKLAVRERLAIDHYMAIAGTDADHGEHVKVTLRTGAAPTHDADTAILYAKDVSSKARPFYIDEDGVEYRMEAFASGVKMLFYQDTAPLGWTIQNTLDDKLVFVTKGSAAGGQTGGGAHSTGTWTQTGHTHAGGTLSNAHYHYLHSESASSIGTSDLGIYMDSQAAADSLGTPHYGGAATTRYLAYNYTNSSVGETWSGASASGAEAATWRPAAYCCIICAKD